MFFPYSSSTPEIKGSDARRGDEREEAYLCAYGDESVGTHNAAGVPFRQAAYWRRPKPLRIKYQFMETNTTIIVPNIATDIHNDTSAVPKNP